MITAHTWRSALRVRGRDRGEYLNRMLSARMIDRAPGERVHALLLDPKGHVLADLDAWFAGAGILLLGDAAALPRVAETLRRYQLRSEIEIDDLSDRSVVIRVLGEIESGDATLPEDGKVGRVQLGGVEMWAARGGRFPGIDFLVSVDDTERVMAHLQAELKATRCGREAWERARIELGIPLEGAELTGHELPQEACLDDAVDYDKGCYPGQETVARIHYRGHVNRMLRVIVAPAPLACGEPLQHQGRTAARVTSCITDDHGTVALAYVRKPAAAGGTELQNADDVAVTVVLPRPPDRL